MIDAGGITGKASLPPHHYNGLDRLDSTNRVYNKDTCVSCCGTCNVAKYRYTEDDFLSFCKRVAEFQTTSRGAVTADDEDNNTNNA
eukprot:3729553-Pyramimonas_sp.AAC.3